LSRYQRIVLGDETGAIGCLSFVDKKDIKNGASVVITNFTVTDGVVRIYESTEIGR